CSTYPHLHFEVVDCKGNLWDPMKLGMFTNAPAYPMEAPAKVMDVIVKQPTITSISAMIDPGPYEPTSVKSGIPFSIGLTVSVLNPQDPLRIDLFNPGGTQVTFPATLTSSSLYLLSHWYWNAQLNTPGTWTAKYYVNGVQQGVRTILVDP